MGFVSRILAGARELPFGGPLGALLERAARHVANWYPWTDGESQNDDPRQQIAFTIAVIALGAKMARADGTVTRDEVAAFRQVFQVPAGEEEHVRLVFDLARKSTAGFDSYARQVRRLFATDRAVLEDLLGGLFHIALADGRVCSAEDDYLREVARHFGFDASEYGRIRAHHVGVAPGASEDPYAILGVGPDAALSTTFAMLTTGWCGEPSGSRHRAGPAAGMHCAGDRSGRPDQRRLRSDREERVGAGRFRMSPPADPRSAFAQPRLPRAPLPRIDMLVLHYTGMATAAAALDRLCDPAARVSAHYVRRGKRHVWRLVPEARRAFHAGRSCWEGRATSMRSRSAIEIVNPGHEWGYRPFPGEQMSAVERLCRDILGRNPIPQHRVVGHSDIAPDRKSDPGELFDWPRLARAGIGIWPQPAPGLARGRGRGVGVVERTAALADLAAIGYCVASGNEPVVRCRLSAPVSP